MGKSINVILSFNDIFSNKEQGGGLGVGEDSGNQATFDRRAGSLPYIAMAGNFFHPTHPHPHTDHPIDFINPDCYLLGKKRKIDEGSSWRIPDGIICRRRCIFSTTTPLFFCSSFCRRMVRHLAQRAGHPGVRTRGPGAAAEARMGSPVPPRTTLALTPWLITQNDWLSVKSPKSQLNHRSVSD